MLVEADAGEGANLALLFRCRGFIRDDWKKEGKEEGQEEEIENTAAKEEVDEGVPVGEEARRRSWREKSRSWSHWGMQRLDGVYPRCSAGDSNQKQNDSAFTMRHWRGKL